MPATREDDAFRKRMQRIEGLIQEVERFPDAAARERTQEIVQALLELHGAALEKTLSHISAAGESGGAILSALAADGLVGSVLLLHGLHPVDLETRVRLAIDKLQPSLRTQGGDVELLGIAEGVIQVRVSGGGHGCHSSAGAIRRTVEEALYEAAPDLAALEIDGAEEKAAGPAVTFIPLEQVRGSLAAGEPKP